MDNILLHIDVDDLLMFVLVSEITLHYYELLWYIGVTIVSYTKIIELLLNRK